MLTQTIPTVAIAPLLVLWFGYDMAPKVVPIVVTTFFSIAVGLLGGFRSVDPNQIDLMRSMGASRLQIMRHVKLPAAMPQFFSGFKISAAYAVVGGRSSPNGSAASRAWASTWRRRRASTRTRA